MAGGAAAHAMRCTTHPQVHEPLDRVRVTGGTPCGPGGRVFPLHQRQLAVHADHLSDRKQPG